MFGRKEKSGPNLKGGAAMALGAAGLFLFLVGAKRTLGGRGEEEMWEGARGEGGHDPEETEARERL